VTAAIPAGTFVMKTKIRFEASACGPRTTHAANQRTLKLTRITGVCANTVLDEGRVKEYVVNNPTDSGKLLIV
jgi:hypothetical protein